MEAIRLFNGALLTFGAAERDTCETHLQALGNSSGVGFHVVNNLRVESRLTIDIMKEFLGAIILVAPDVEQIKKTYIDKCREHILKGGRIPKPWPIFYGRAVTPKRFYHTMMGLGYFTSETEARRFFRNLLFKPIHIIKRRLRNMYLGNFLMWATFNANNLDGDPFINLPVDADGIRGRLGLDRNEKGEDLFLFIYKLPINIEPLFPTIADGQWFAQFHPAPQNKNCGLTMPWTEFEENKPVPEVVHKPIKGVCLTEPIKRVLG